MHGDLRGCGDAKANLIAPHIHDRNLNIVADHNYFVSLPGQHQHL